MRLKLKIDNKILICIKKKKKEKKQEKTAKCNFSKSGIEFNTVVTKTYMAGAYP